MAFSLVYQLLIVIISIMIFTYFYNHSIIQPNEIFKKGCSCMREGTIFPREEKTEVLFQKILDDPWACEKLQETFCNYLFCDDEIDTIYLHQNSHRHYSMHITMRFISLFDGYCENTIFDLLRNSYLIPYRFNADGIENPVI